MNENEDTICQILWNATKAVLRGKLIAVNASIKKEERSQINNLHFHLKTLGGGLGDRSPSQKQAKGSK